MLELEPTVPTTELLLEGFEKQFELTLPGDYRRFLLSKNGGRCKTGGVLREVGTGEKISRMRRLLGISPVSFEGIEQSLADLETRMPDGLVPIGEDSGGNTVLLDCSDDSTRGNVYFLDLDRASDEHPPSRRDLPLIATSFSQLLASMEEE